MNESGAGKVAVVTGGASGIGEACCRVLASKGWQVVVADVNAARAAEVARSIGGDHLAFDVTEEEATQGAAQECEARFGPVSALVASAGVSHPTYPPETFAMNDFDRVIAINLRGVYLSCAAFGGRMARQGHGAIVTIGSVTASRAVPLHAYAPSKAAVVHMTQCLAAEWARSGVRVNTVNPGYVLTPLLKSAIERGERDRASVTDTAAMQRTVEPVEVANAVAFLLSDDASAITGVALPVDAGWLVGAHLATYGGVRPPRTEAPA